MPFLEISTHLARHKDLVSEGTLTTITTTLKELRVETDRKGKKTEAIGKLARTLKIPCECMYNRENTVRIIELIGRKISRLLKKNGVVMRPQQ